MKYDVLCFGEMVSCDLVFGGLKDLPDYGEEQLCEKFLIVAGGSANTPMALAKLGAKTAFMTRLGDDMVGNIVYEELAKAGICMDCTRKDPDYGTCVSAVLSAPKDRAFATYFDQSPSVFAPEDVKKAISQSKAVYADVKTCANIPAIVEAVKEYGKELYLDIGTDESQKLEDYAEILKAGVWFMPNDKEALSLTRTQTVSEAVAVLHRYIPGVVIKCGGDGCVVSWKGEAKTYPAHRELTKVDTTGAGDNFCAGFVYGCVSGMDSEKAAAIANASGGLAITFMGGNSPLYTRQRVMELANL